VVSSKRVLAFTQSIAVLVVLSQAGSAQEASELRNLVFEPIPLAAAIASPIDRARPAATDSRALRDSVAKYLAVIEPQRLADPSAPGPPPQLASTGLAHPRLERHHPPIETFDEAIAVAIHNGGTDNPERIPRYEQKNSS
jgi:hypothetical protein